MDASQMVTLVKDVILALAAVITATTAVTAAVVGVRGLRKWQEEMRGKAEFEAARALAKATYKFRDALATCRSRMIWGVEYPKGHNHATKSDEEKAGALQHVYYERFKAPAEAMRELDAQLLEAEALWGNHIRDIGRELIQCFAEVQFSASEIIADTRSGGNNFQADPEHGKSCRSRAHGGPIEEGNDLSAAIRRLVGEMEGELRQHLRKGA